MLQTISTEPPAPKGSRGLLLKILVICLLSGVILIALAWIADTISERESYRNDAVKSISDSYASSLRLIGPVVIQPYTRTRTEVNPGEPPKTFTEDLAAATFPVTMQTRGEIVSSERHHGLYNVPVYEFHGHIEGSIDIPPATALDSVTVVGRRPYLAFGVSDVRGLVGNPVLMINGAPVALTQNTGGYTPNGMRLPLRAELPDVDLSKPAHINFSLDLVLDGTQQFSIAPIANLNHVELRSAWPAPLFEGRFLPRSRNVSPAGFRAAWDITSLAAATQQQASDNINGSLDVLTVSLLQPINTYKLSMRAVKYGALFVLLTFAGFFIYEVMNSLPIHPVQYLLIGLGLSIFFLLLISLSEHIAFAAAYSISSVACIGLLSFYLTHVLHSLSRAMGFSVLLTLLYSSLYGLLLSEDNALLLGSILLFAILAFVMYITRHVDWYRRSTELEQVKLDQSDIS